MSGENPSDSSDVRRPADEPELQATVGVMGHLLCAVPQLTDPNFARSVILVVSHDAQGAMGLVLNRLCEMNLSEVADSLGLSWEGARGKSVRLGGPVEPSRGFILHDDPQWDPAAEALGPNLLVTVSLDAVQEHGTVRFGAGDHTFDFFLGYAGWSAEQLDAEIAAGSWVIVPVNGIASSGRGVSVRWLFETAPDRMWQQALAAIGIDPARLIGLNTSTVMVH